MNCSKCNAEVEEGSGFCTKCGEPVGIIESGPENLLQEAEAAVVKKPGIKRKKMILIISACVLVAACAVLIPVMIEAANAAKYEDAFALMDTDELLAAKEEFIELGGYKDCVDMAQTCQNMVDYATANDLMKANDYAGAKVIFDRLDGYEKSVRLSAECQNMMDYNDAVAMMDAGETEEALVAFTALGEYSDSKAMAEECQNWIDYSAAKALMDAGDFKAAETAFAHVISYKDSRSLMNTCYNEVQYIDAEEAYSLGEYYTAYVTFRDLNDFKDSASRAEQCIQPNPKSGQIFRNPDYKSKKCPITFKAPKDGILSYIKIYTKDDKLVSTVFVGSGKKVKIKLPKGTFRFKIGYGEKWFGDEAFGGEGRYFIGIFDKGKDTWSLKGGWIYTISLRPKNGGNPGIGEDYEDFLD